jgi:phosphatidylserine decarboxylase
MLKFLYKNFIGRHIRLPFTLLFFSKMGGSFADSKLSRYFIKSFIKHNKIDMSDYVVPDRGYKTFNEFFYRKLKPGKRVIDQDPCSIISPADSKLLVIPEINTRAHFFIKSCKFNLEKFLQDQDLASEFARGTLLLFRLAPENYHRFHFPFDCVTSAQKVIKGKFESVNPIVYESGVQPLTENERHLIILDSEKFGRVLFVPVGAMLVGKVIETYDPNEYHKKGDEVGYFAFGGSSIVMLFQKGVITPSETFIQNSLHDRETSIKIGQVVAKV